LNDKQRLNENPVQAGFQVNRSQGISRHVIANEAKQPYNSSYEFSRFGMIPWHVMVK